jgi:hypothetical protein
MFRFVAFLFALTCSGILAPAGKAQSFVGSSATTLNTAATPAAVDPTQPVFPYSRPTEKMKLRTYVFDAIGPYPIVGAAFIAAVNQREGTPPEWGQGAAAYGQRFGSNLAIAGITTTTRYALAETFREDTVYYRCDCKGVFRRLGHALISTVTARRGEDGHRHLSFPSSVAPYAGTMTAVYAWYPERYSPKDALRMGNYNLLAFGGGNVALEFIYGGPHTLFSRLHRPTFSGRVAGSTSNHSAF